MCVLVAIKLIDLKQIYSIADPILICFKTQSVDARSLEFLKRINYFFFN